MIKMINLTLRKKDKKYYQLGYYEGKNWINLKHLGTAEKIAKYYSIPNPLLTKNLIENESEN